MGISFSADRWKEIGENYQAYWDGKLNRLLCGVAVRERDPGFDCPNVPYPSMSMCLDFSIAPEAIADRVLWELSRYEFYGDAYPVVDMAWFGAGAMAAFLGSNYGCASGTIWFSPKEKYSIENFNFEYDPDNKYFVRLKAVYAALIDRLEGKACIGMTDLGGIMDVLGSFFHGEDLLLALYDQPEHVSRLVKQLDALWKRYFDEITGILGSGNNGFTSWCTLYSPKPAYITQCDFSYMISPNMFGQFVMPSMEAHCAHLDNVAYHMDGHGQLPHLQQLLSLDKLRSIQWVAGDGKPSNDYYVDLYKQILDAGKVIQLTWCTPEIVKNVTSKIGGAGVFHPMYHTDAADKDYFLSALEV